ncbi:unnamed protein product [Sympodiomycopsis kandeliae]
MSSSYTMLSLFSLLLGLATLLVTVQAAPAPRKDVNVTLRGQYPNSPGGARLVHLRPCGSPATVPAFVNSQWASSGQKSQAESVYISQHGAGTDFDYYFSSVNNVVGGNAAVIAPGFYNTNAPKAPSSWYEPGSTLAWAPEELTWGGGYDSVSPGGSSCSSFSVYDDILSQVTNRQRFPKLRNIYFVGHSGGANMVQRWSIIGQEPAGYHVRYIVANTAAVAYFSGARPVDYNADACPKAKQYPYQMVRDNMPSYVSSRFGGDGDTSFRNWARRDVVTLIGDFDTINRYPSGTQSCEAQAQGGQNRRERQYAFWAYRNLKAGTKTDVSAYFGYGKLAPKVKSTGAAQGFNHQNCVIPKVGHVAADMFNSACGRQALFGQAVTGSVGAKYN